MKIQSVPDYAAEDAAAMKRVGMVVTVLIAVALGLIAAATLVS